MNERQRAETWVVAALICREERFLICQRPPEKARGLLWEFAGGKVEPGERPEQALVRECREELAITVTPGPVYAELIHDYPELRVRLTVFQVREFQGEPQLLEHRDLRWIRPEESGEFDFCPADRPLLERLRREGLPG